jgi:uncharacterized protein (DUF433 family)
MNTSGIIHDRGRGPEIKGSRITVYDVLDYHKQGWEPSRIAELFHLPVEQIAAAVAYIDSHEVAVMKEYQKMLDREVKGNPPEVQAKLDGLRGLARKRRDELAHARKRELNDARISGRP